ncbi:hypothetical protein Hanom_Chr02g00098581 [Helianthus anomalus]
MPYRSLDTYGACTRRRSLWDANFYAPYLIITLYKLMNCELMFWTYVLCFRC